jgi:protein TonB
MQYRLLVFFLSIVPTIAYTQAVSATTQMPPTLPPGRVRVSSGVLSGLKIKGEMPHYSEEAKRAGGAVTLHAIIGKDGHVMDASVVSGPELRRAATLRAVRDWEYKPYLLNGEPVEVDTTISIIVDYGR